MANGDTFDEQMSGFGELIRDFTRSFERAYGVTDDYDQPVILADIATYLGNEDENPVSKSINTFVETLKEGIDRYMDNRFDA